MNVLAIHARMGQPAKTKLMHIRVPVHMVRKTWQSLAKKNLYTTAREIGQLILIELCIFTVIPSLKEPIDITRWSISII